MFLAKMGLTNRRWDIKIKLLIMGSRVRVPPRSPCKSGTIGVYHSWYCSRYWAGGAGGVPKNVSDYVSGSLVFLPNGAAVLGHDLHGDADLRSPRESLEI